MVEFTNHRFVLIVGFVLTMCGCVSTVARQDTIDPKEIPSDTLSIATESANSFNYWPSAKSKSAEVTGDRNVISFVGKLQSLHRGMSIEYAENLLGIRPVKIVYGDEWGIGPEWESRVYFKMFRGEAVFEERRIDAIAFSILVWNGEGGKWIAEIAESE